jgi:ferredoxin
MPVRQVLLGVVCWDACEEEKLSTPTDIYRELQRHLDGLPIGYPATELGVEIRILRQLFTPEEARVAVALTMMPEPLERIHKRMGRAAPSPEQLRQMLDAMVGKGIVLASTRDEKTYYRNAMLAVGMYELQVERLTEQLARDIDEYLGGAFGEEMYRTRIPQLRTIPIEESVRAPDKYSLASYDEIRQVIEEAGTPIAVANCVCRQSKDLLGQSCHATDLRETCLQFRGWADYSVGLGLARVISKEDALDILDKAQQAGLVLQPENTRRPGYVCCCCGDCCAVLTTVKRFPRPAELYASNHYAEVEEGLCTGCQLCVDGCQLEAPRMRGNVVAIDRDRCIGCGNCVVKCPCNAIQLRKKETESLPPKDTKALYAEILGRKLRQQQELEQNPLTNDTTSSAI